MRAGLLAFGILLLISSHSANKYAKSRLSSSEVLPRPLVLTIALILSGIFRESNASLIWSLSSPLILLDMPPDLDELGIKTIKRPASPICVVRAAPLVPLSSFVT